MKAMHLLTNAALLGFMLSIALVSCGPVTVVQAPTPARRTGSSSDGSARWAFDLARERVEAKGFDADNELYVIEGALIWNDGRLPADRGSWHFWFWNESQHLKLEIEVRYDGEILANTETKPQSPAGRPAMPANWADSTAIFQAAPAFSSNVVDSAMTNLANWPAEPKGAFWVIGCILSRGCPVHYVRWDGIYLGDKFP